jgi:hypothetical protein
MSGRSLRMRQAVGALHQRTNTGLAGESSAITVEGDGAVPDLYPFTEAAEQTVGRRGLRRGSVIPEIQPTVELFPAPR